MPLRYRIIRKDLESMAPASCSATESSLWPRAHETINNNNINIYIVKQYIIIFTTIAEGVIVTILLLAASLSLFFDIVAMSIINSLFFCGRMSLGHSGDHLVNMPLFCPRILFCEKSWVLLVLPRSKAVISAHSP